MNNTIISVSSILLTIILGKNFTRTNTNTLWFRCIKSDITPPNYIFPIVWTILYILLGISYKKILDDNNRDVIILFNINLLLNISWTYFYFYKKNVNHAFTNIILLILTNIIILYKKPKLKYYLMPYILWLVFASYLNYDSLNKNIMCKK
jgi:benzodiazapine receptor